MKWWSCIIVALTVLIVQSSSKDVKDSHEISKEIMYGNHQNKISKGMFDNELVNSKKDEQHDDDAPTDPDENTSGEAKGSKDKLGKSVSRPVTGEDNGDITDEMSYQDAMGSMPYNSQKYNDPYRLNLNRGGWNNYDRYYYYDQDSDGPPVFRKKRNMDVARPLNALKRTPRKRAPLRTPLEQLVRSRSSLKRSVRVKRDISPYYQEKLVELLAEIAERKAQEDSEREKYLRFRERFTLPYNQDTRDELLASLLDYYPIKLHSNVGKQIAEDLKMENIPNDIDSSEDDDLMRGENDVTDNSPDETDMPTFFRRPYQRRSDSTFYPAPNAHQWLVSGQKRSLFNRGRWGRIEDKRRDNNAEDEIEEIDPAKLYLFASLLDGDDDMERFSSQRPRKRLIL